MSKCEWYDYTESEWLLHRSLHWSVYLADVQDYVGRCILALTRGICQDRLRYWGEDVLVGVTTNDNSLKFVRLGELMPYYWGKAYDHGNN